MKINKHTANAYTYCEKYNKQCYIYYAETVLTRSTYFS